MRPVSTEDNVAPDVTPLSHDIVTPRKTEINKNPHTQSPTTTVHGRAWKLQSVESGLNETNRHHDRSARGPVYQVISDSYVTSHKKQIGLFLRTFPQVHLPKVIEVTNLRLAAN